jgi:hypothetical protein
MREDVVVPECWNYRDDKVVGGVGIVYVVRLPKDFDKLFHHIFIEFDDLLVRSRESFIIVMPSRIASPNHEINLIFDIVLNPLEGRVDQGKGSVAVCHFGTIIARLAFAGVASLV